MLQKRFELFRRGVSEEQRQWKNETDGLRQKIEQLEKAVNLNIEKTEDVSHNVSSQIQRNIEVNKNNLKTALDIDFKSIVSEFKTNITDEVSATIADYANNTSAVSNALFSMQEKIDTASAEIERQIDSFEASIDQKTKEINENLEEQCKQRKTT